VCVWEIEREKEGEKERKKEREREKEWKRDREIEREREREGNWTERCCSPYFFRSNYFVLIPDIDHKPIFLSPPHTHSCFHLYFLDGER
jgi:hypothetical protein